MTTIIRYEGKDYLQPRKELTWWQKIFRSKGKQARYEYDSAQILKALQNSREKFVEELEKKTIQDILQNPSYRPTYDILSIQHLADEYQTASVQEKAFMQAFMEWIENIRDTPIFEKLMSLLLTLGVVMSTDISSKKHPLSALKNNLQVVVTNTQLATQLLHAGLPSLPEQSSGAIFDKSIEQLQNIFYAIHEGITKATSMHTPEALAKIFVDEIKATYQNSSTDTTRDEDKMMEEVQKQLVAYKKLYDQKQTEKDQRLQDAQKIRNTLIDLVLLYIDDESDSTLSKDLAKEVASQKKALGDLHNLDDMTLEKTYDHLQEVSMTIQTEQQEQQNIYEKGQTIMESLLEKAPTTWKTSSADKLLTRARWKEKQQMMPRVFGRLAKVCQSLIDKVVEEQRTRKFLKLQKKYTALRKTVCDAYEKQKKQLYNTEIKRIDQERKTLGEQIQSDMSKASSIKKELTTIEQKAKNLLTDASFLEACDIAISTKFDLGTKEQQLVDKKIYTFPDDVRQRCIQTLATQELDGMDPTDEHFFDTLIHQKTPQQHSSFPELTSGPEVDRITTFRTNFKQQITGTIDHPIAIAQSMIADGSFRLSTCGGLPMGEYHLDGTSYGIVNAAHVLTEEDYKKNKKNIGSYNYSSALRPGTSYEPKRKAINKQNLSERPNATIRDKIQSALDAGGVPMHHTGVDQTHNDFSDTCQAIMKKYTLSNNDALLVMMYLQGLYGDYWVGGNRGYVNLHDDNRRFDSDVNDGNNASLLVSVKNHLLSRSEREAHPLSQEALAHTTYRNKMVEYAEEYDTQYLDEIKQWYEITNNLIDTDQIKQSPEGIEMVGLGFEMLRKSVHDKLIKDKFTKDVEYSEQSYDDHAGSRINLEVRKDAVDRFIQEKKTFGAGIKLGEKEHFEEMLEWIAKKYNVNDTKKQYYILLMINPDLFGRHWMKDTDGDYRHFLRLSRNVDSRYVDELSNPAYECGLFLVR